MIGFDTTPKETRSCRFEAGSSGERNRAHALSTNPNGLQCLLWMAMV